MPLKAQNDYIFQNLGAMAFLLPPGYAYVRPAANCRHQKSN